MQDSSAFTFRRNLHHEDESIDASAVVENFIANVVWFLLKVVCVFAGGVAAAFWEGYGRQWLTDMLESITQHISPKTTLPTAQPEGPIPKIASAPPVSPAKNQTTVQMPYY
uniref:Uncharacterized protein n=1 Tax=Panagrolaimus davidi TaxID=227884 RepID=A0A914QGI3_9BILA